MDTNTLRTWLFFILFGCSILGAPIGLWMVGRGWRAISGTSNRREQGEPLPGLAAAWLQSLVGVGLVFSLPCYCAFGDSLTANLVAIAEREGFARSRAPIQVGLTTEEVRQILGAPDRTRNGGAEWIYSITHGEFGVEFDDEGRVKRTWQAD